jgi:NTE family protein
MSANDSSEGVAELAVDTPPERGSRPPTQSALSGMGALASQAAQQHQQAVFDLGDELPVPRINLALQGGGAHGAFTWGVLDALLEDGRVDFEGLSGCSAGAMNAVLLVNGWMTSPRGAERDGARQALADFWNDVGQPIPPGVAGPGVGDTFTLLPAGRWIAHWAGYFSPAELNPLALNPLRDLLSRLVDFERLRAHSPFKLFVGATQANTGKLRVFREQEMSLDVMMASACLPKMYEPVEIDGQPYWDGGYCANPPVSPLFYDCDSEDILLVLLNPLLHTVTPHTAQEIETRLQEMATNANFMREMQLFAQVAQFNRADALRDDNFAARLHQTRFHMINANALDSLQRSETKALAHTPFLNLLHRQGRERAAAWLAAYWPALGRRATIDIGELFG